MGKTADTFGEFATAGQHLIGHSDEIDQLMKEIDRDWKNINILVMGQTGVGKSTLVNAMFGTQVAKTGVGKPVTFGIQKYEGTGVTLYDTEGLELDACQQLRLTDSLCTLIQQQNEQGVSESIHMIWYCVAASSSRLQTKELELLQKVVSTIKSASLNIPVIFVVTKPCLIQAEKYQEFMDVISSQVASLFPGAENNVIAVNSIAVTTGFGPYVNTIPQFGLKELSDKVTEHLPQALHDSWIRASAADLENKRKLAKRVLMADTALVSAVAAGATAASIDDSIALIAAEVHLFAKIGSIYNFHVDIHKTTAIVLGGIGTTVAAGVGKTIFGWILALSTGGLSKIAEGAIRIGIADGLVISLGMAFIALMENFAKGEISEDEVTKRMESLLIDKNKKAE